MNTTTTTTEQFRYVRNGSTAIVYDTQMKHGFGDGYIGDIWHDDETAALIRRPYWNINNGTTYLWGFATREAATMAMLDVTLAVK